LRGAQGENYMQHRQVALTIAASALVLSASVGTSVPAFASTGNANEGTATTGSQPADSAPTGADSTNPLDAAPLPLAPPNAADAAAARTALAPASKPKKKKKEKTPAQIHDGKKTLVLGDTGRAVIVVQNRLNQAGIETTVSGKYSKNTRAQVRHFQSKFLLGNSGTVSKNTWNKLRSVTKRGANLDQRCYTKGKVMCIDMTQRTLRYVKKGKIITILDARFGSQSNPTRLGVNHVYSKVEHNISTEYHTPMPYSMFFDGGIAVHYSMFFKAVGYNGNSHGCVNIRDYNGVKKLYSQIPIGTKVVVYK